MWAERAAGLQGAYLLQWWRRLVSVHLALQAAHASACCHSARAGGVGSGLDASSGVLAGEAAVEGVVLKKDPISMLVLEPRSGGHNTRAWMARGRALHSTGTARSEAVAPWKHQC
jgi:hypothetical protein